MEKLGVPTLEAYTDPETPTCFGIYARKTLDSSGRRLSTYHAFLPKRLVRQRKNLTICLGATVQRILFSEHLRATGLLVESGKKKFTIHTKREIILSGGPVVTPQLLLLRYSIRFLLTTAALVQETIWKLSVRHVYMTFPALGLLSLSSPRLANI